MRHKKVKLIASLLFCLGLTGLKAQNVKDIDGNVYATITIGKQVWMAENLKTTKYNDGKVIPMVPDDKVWHSSSDAYCWYNNDATANKNRYGALYNWYTVNTNKLCPTGWHVPTDAEWTTLIDYLTDNGYGYAGSGKDIAKSMAATSGWATNSKAGVTGNDQTGNNRSGFTALPGGSRYGLGPFYSIGYYGHWWSATEYDASLVWYYSLSFVYGSVQRYLSNRHSGFSVRCLRDY